MIWNIKALREKGNSTAITDWPTDERPREKLLVRGAESLSDAELLAIFLRTGQQGMTAVDLARSQLTAGGGLRALLDASPERMARLPGMGVARRALLLAALLFTFSLLFRTLDMGLCSQIPFGTHFLWHMCNAGVLYLSIRAYLYSQ